MLYVVTQGVRADDQQALAAFTAATASREAGPGQRDRRAEQGRHDRRRVRRRLRRRRLAGGETARGEAGAELKPRVADVLPVIGLIAESAETGGFTSADADALRQLAELDDATGRPC